MLAVAPRTAAVFPPLMTTEQPNAPSEAQILGLAIRRLRSQAGMTQAEAAEAYGCDPKSWYRYEKGERELTFEQLKDVAAAVGATREELLAFRDMIAVGREGKTAANQHGFSEPQRQYAAAPRRQRVIDLPEGDFIVSYPAELSAESRAEIADQLASLLRRFQS